MLFYDVEAVECAAKLVLLPQALEGLGRGAQWAGHPLRQYFVSLSDAVEDPNNATGARTGVGAGARTAGARSCSCSVSSVDGLHIKVPELQLSI